LTTETVDDIVGLVLEPARERAAEAGYEIVLVETRPPHAGRGRGAARVVRVRPAGPGVLELTVAREDYAGSGEGRA